MIEREWKGLINKEQYEKLLKKINWDKEIRMNNYYYMDSKFILEDENICVRVREIDEKKVLQIKRGIASSENIFLSEEREINIENIPELLEEAIINREFGLNIHDLKLIGFLQTTRMVKMENGNEFCLDKCDYLGMTDYELEIEFVEGASFPLFWGIYNDNGVRNKSKFVRFLEVLKKCNA